MWTRAMAFWLRVQALSGVCRANIQRHGFVVLLMLLFLVPRSEAIASTFSDTAASTCATSGPSSSAYSVTVCFSSPSGGAILTGNTTLTATVSVSGTSPGVQSMLFNLDGTYLLTDFQSSYTFVLQTGKWIDGSHSLAAQAHMRDGFVTQQAAISVTFSNGVTTPPVNNNHFQPTSGRPANGSPFIVAAIGDGASGQTYPGTVSNLIMSLNPNLFIYLGDVYNQGTGTEFYNWYGTSSTYFGRLRSITDPTIGNHEYLTANAPGYFDYWNNIPNYYSYSANGWHFISLNSNGQHVPTGSGSAQYQWLQQDLASVPGNACKIVYYHHPLFNIGPEEPDTGMTAIWQLLAQDGVPVVLNGHDHDYQRWVPLDGNGNPSSNGITEFVAGTGGHSMQTFIRTDSRVAYSNDTNPTAFGFLVLQLNQSGANFYYKNTSGTVLDSGVIPCSPGTPDASAPATPGGFTATAVSSSKVNLTWTAATDNVGVSGYTIYRNGTAIKTVSAVQLSYSDTNVAASTTYSYSVDAFDLSGNHSPKTAPVFVTTPSASGDLVFGDRADAYVNASYPGTNFGTLTTLRTDASPNIHSYLRFTVTGLTGRPVIRALLKVYANSGSSIGIGAAAVADNTWSETTLTYNNAPALGGMLASSGSISSGTWVSLDVTSYVTAEATYSFGLTTSSSTAISFQSKEASANPPQLVLTLGASATPTPTRASTPTPTATRIPSKTPTPTSTGATAATPTPAAPATATPTPTSSSSQSVTFVPDADAYVNSGSPTTNYGTSIVLRADGSPDLHSYARFAVSWLNGSPIKRVRLLFYMNSSSSAGMQVLSVSDNTWGEKTITYSSAPALGSTIAASGSLTSGTWMSLDVSSYVMAEGTYSFGIITPGSTAISFASRESGANAPQLIVDLSP